MKKYAHVILVFGFVATLTYGAFAQPFEFTYQGSLNFNGQPANGNFDFEFALFGLLSGGTPVDSALTRPNVSVTNGIFTVSLDFGESFNGAHRYLEIRVRPAGGGAYTALTPRQFVSSSPYALQSRNAQLASFATEAGSAQSAFNATNAEQANTALTANTATTAGNVTGIVGIANGGTGSSTKNFVDLTSFQFIDGNKVFLGELSGNGNGFLNVPGTLHWLNAPSSVAAIRRRGYIASSHLEVTVTLPTDPVLGDLFGVVGSGTGGWRIAQNAGQSIITQNLGFSWVPVEGVRTWSGIASSSDGVKLVATVQGGQIYTSIDSGATWTPRETNRTWNSVASSSDGTKLVASVNGGQLYTSTDSGATWTPRETNRFWNEVASSSDGVNLVAVTGGEQIYTSTDSGLNWTPRDSNRNWQTVASSSDGTKLVAGVAGGQIYTSSNSGATWIPRETSRSWRDIATSSDGVKLVALANDSQIYLSTDSGVNWTPTENARAWRSVSCSADGSRIAAVVFGGLIYISTDSGVTWQPSESNRQWRTIASSVDGTRLWAGGTASQLYSLDNSTTEGVNGYIKGGRASSIELVYVGNGQFMPIRSFGRVTYF